MRHLSFLLVTTFLSISTLGCHAEKGELQQHADACESLCSSTLDQCAAEPGFEGSWQLSCEVSCNLDFNDETRPYETCIEAAGTCAEKNACGGGFPVGTDDGAADSLTAADSDPSETTDPGESSGADDGASDPTVTAGDESTGGESTGDPLVGDPCCDVSGAGCQDADVQQCVCDFLPACCAGPWDETCAGLAVANGCIEGGCSTLEDQTEWSCTCETSSVYCPDDPFVSQIYFGADACGASMADALAIVTNTCEHGSGTCEVTAGSCDCTCERAGVGCGPM